MPGNHPAVLFQTALRLHAAGRRDQARQLYLEHLAAHPGDSQALFALGVVCLDLGEPAEAARHLEKAGALDPGNADAALGLGRAHYALGDYAKALAIQDKLTPLYAATFLEAGVTGAKSGLFLLGKASEDVRLPLVSSTDRTREAIRAAMIYAGVLAATGANGFERRHADATFMQITCEQRSQHRFANAGVRAGDKKRGSLHSSTSKRKCGWESIKTVDGRARGRLD